VKKWGLQTLILLIPLSGAFPLHAQGGGAAFLQVCNKGTVTVSVVVGMENEDMFSWYNLDVSGWVRLTPGACERVYNHRAVTESPPAGYIGFAFFDSQGQFTPARIDSVPNLGSYHYTFLKNVFRWGSDGPVLSKSKKTLCVHQAVLSYSVKTESYIDCSTFHPRNDAGLFYPLTTQLQFLPTPHQISIETGATWGGEFYLDVAPKPGDPDLHASKGTESGADAKDDVDAGKVLKQLGDAIDAARRRELEKERAAAEAERQRRAQAEGARQKRLEIAAANGDPNAKLSLEVAARLEAESRLKWSAPRLSPGAYVPRWMDENIVLRGTVARVEVKATGFPQWLTVFFKESPDATFVVCSPYPELFQQKFGKDFSGMIGKTFEVVGRVETPYCAGKTASIRVLEAQQLRLAGPEQPNVNDGKQATFGERIRPAEMSFDDYRRANSHPLMVGKVNVIMFSGLVLGDPPARAERAYGKPTADRGTEQLYGPGGRLVISYTRQNSFISVRRIAVESSELSWVRSHLAAFGVPHDPLLELLGQSESAAVALLGPPQKRESHDAQTYNLYWTFEMAGFSPGDPNATSNQTVALAFKAGLGCISISVTW
jgi:hypothetical protein